MATCKVGRLLGRTDLMPQPDRATLRGWLDSLRDNHGRQVPAGVMANALTREGHTIGQTSLKDHRGRRCVCFREGVTA